MSSLDSLMSMAFIMLVVFFDAARLRREHPSLYLHRVGLRPWIWAVLTGIFLFVTLPLYLFVRERYFEDHQRLPSERREAAGARSFLKTCLSAKILIAWFWAVQTFFLIGTFLLQRMGFSLQTQTIDLSLWGTFFYVCAFFAVSHLAAREYPSFSFLEVFDLRYAKVKKSKLFTVPLLVSFLMAVLTILLLMLRKVPPPTPLGVTLAQSSSGAKLVFLVFAAFLAPFFEELLYRGLFFRVLLKNKGKLWAIFGTSVCFWALHADRAGDPLALGVLFVFSVCVTWIRFWTRTTLSAVLMHYTYNLSIALISLLLLIATDISLFQSNFIDFYPKSQHESILMKAMERNPERAEPYNNLAWFYATQERNLERALSLVNRAIEIEPESSAPYDTKAVILFKLGKVQDAIALEEVLTRRYPAVDYFRQQLSKFRRRMPDASPEKHD